MKWSVNVAWGMPIFTGGMWHFRQSVLALTGQTVFLEMSLGVAVLVSLAAGEWHVRHRDSWATCDI
jgi:hypothetical protein